MFLTIWSLWLFLLYFEDVTQTKQRNHGITDSMVAEMFYIISWGSRIGVWWWFSVLLVGWSLFVRAVPQFVQALKLILFQLLSQKYKQLF